jgi:hypothetical protein
MDAIRSPDEVLYRIDDNIVLQISRLPAEFEADHGLVVHWKFSDPPVQRAPEQEPPERRGVYPARRHNDNPVVVRIEDNPVLERLQ